MMCAFTSLGSVPDTWFADHGAKANECAVRSDPSSVLEALAGSQQWNIGADMADAYGSGCDRPCADPSESWNSAGSD
jgi:hypothetical protein